MSAIRRGGSSDAQHEWAWIRAVSGSRKREMDDGKSGVPCKLDSGTYSTKCPMRGNMPCRSQLHLAAAHRPMTSTYPRVNYSTLQYDEYVPT